MPQLSVAVPHALDRGEVVARLKGHSEALRSSFGTHVQDFEETWDNHALVFRFKTFGMSVDGRVSVEPAEVQTTVNLPLAAMMFKGTIEKQMREGLEKLLGPGG